MQKLDLNRVNIRIMKQEDIDSIINIDAKISGRENPEYYRRKCKMALDDSIQMVTSLVAEYDGKVIGFVMGNLFIGEFGIPEPTASIDTIGVDPEYQNQGLGNELIDQCISHMRKAGAESVYILVNWNDWAMLRLFEKKGFAPAASLKLERSLI